MTDIEELINENKEENTTDEDFMRAAALAYARYLKEHGLAPGDVSVEEDAEAEAETEAKEEKPTTEEPVEEAEEAPADEEASEEVEVEAEAETEAETTEEEPVSEEPAEEKAETEKPETEDKPEEKPAEKKSNKDKKKEEAWKQYKESFKKQGSGKDPLAAIVSFHDKIQDKLDEAAGNVGRGFAKGAHDIASTYRNSRKTIGLAILCMGLIAAVLLVVFDRFTVYEYAYNGKTLGYVKEQEEVTDVLDVAGRKLTQNTETGAKVEFVANQNVTFNPVDGRGKSTDDADTAVNKLIYMTDIETEAYGVYDGPQLKAIVKDQEDAERLLEETKAELSTPDAGMELVSSDFLNPLEIKPINVLLGSVQSNQAARRQMIDGGKLEVYHIVDSADLENPDIQETDSEEELQSKMIAALADNFGVDTASIFDENNRDVITSVEAGDVVCIRSTVDPVSVRMVETGRIKETIEYKTIKKESDEYYQGDTYIEQEGKNGSRIFEGTITKVAGEEESRETISEEITKEPKDKIILIGTKERPKTAATGTFQMPIKSYVVTSEYGGRWGRMHDGMDFGAPTGTTIYAADGGTIIRASYYGGYGNCIEVDHENGYVTRYAHCSAILVSVGDKVYQGQEIGRVGNTGHSFGSHLHFEVRVNGASQNPRNYVNP